MTQPRLSTKRRHAASIGDPAALEFAAGNTAAFEVMMRVRRRVGDGSDAAIAIDALLAHRADHPEDYPGHMSVLDVLLDLRARSVITTDQLAALAYEVGAEVP